MKDIMKCPRCKRLADYPKCQCEKGPQMKKLHIVTLELEVAVWAETPEDAREVAIDERAFDDAMTMVDPSDMTAKVATHYPAGWEDDNYVYGAHDMTLKDALDQTPEYAESVKYFNSLMEKHNANIAKAIKKEDPDAVS